MDSTAELRFLVAPRVSSANAGTESPFLGIFLFDTPYCRTEIKPGAPDERTIITLQTTSFCMRLRRTTATKRLTKRLPKTYILVSLSNFNPKGVY